MKHNETNNTIMSRIVKNILFINRKMIKKYFPSFEINRVIHFFAIYDKNKSQFQPPI